MPEEFLASDFIIVSFQSLGEELQYIFTDKKLHLNEFN